MRVLVLGPLSLVVAGREVAVRGRKRRAALALLALADGATVSSSELIDAVWPDDPPARADGALQSHISRLRAHLGAAGDRLTSGAQGDRRLLLPGGLDVRGELRTRPLHQPRRILEREVEVRRAAQDGQALTRRCLQAIRHPLVNVITHPANQLVGRRAGYPLDYEQIYETAAETGTALEIDGAPSHLDLDGDHATVPLRPYETAGTLRHQQGRVRGGDGRASSE